MTSASEPTGLTTEQILAIERPHSSLMTYYVLSSLLAGPLFPFVLTPLYFRYHTMRYRFSNEGVAMRWGILFRREINLTFARIQDIHLTSNVVERWLGLARIQIQTASGSAKAEMIIEGVPQYGALRDFLYSRMRGVRSGAPVADAAPPGPTPGTGGGEGLGEVAAALAEAVGELRAIREALERREEGKADG